jgi:hypothetical protein
MGAYLIVGFGWAAVQLPLNSGCYSHNCQFSLALLILIHWFVTFTLANSVGNRHFTIPRDDGMASLPFTGVLDGDCILLLDIFLPVLR